MSKTIIVYDLEGRIFSTHEGMEGADATQFAQGARDFYKERGYSVMEHEAERPFEVNAEEHFVQDGKPVYRGRQPSTNHVFDFKQCAWKVDAGIAADNARTRRAQFLKDSDWSQGADVPPPTRQKWQSYRQALRDVPQQPGFPLTIEWPVAPQ